MDQDADPGLERAPDPLYPDPKYCFLGQRLLMIFIKLFESVSKRKQIQTQRHFTICLNKMTSATYIGIV